MGQSFLGKARQYFCTSTSRSSFPRSESCRIAVAVMGLEIEPSRNRVADVAGTKFSRSGIPKPRDQASAPFSTTATEIPGTPPMVMKLDTARSTCARLSAENPLLWARRDEGPKRKPNSTSAIEQVVGPIFGEQVTGIGFTGNTSRESLSRSWPRREQTRHAAWLPVVY